MYNIPYIIDNGTIGGVVNAYCIKKKKENT